MRLTLKHLDLLLASAVALLVVATSLLTPDLASPLRVGMGMLLLLFLPGYCLMVALFPHRSDISSLERLAISVGLSIVVVPVAGLILTNTPWGIRFDTVALILAAYVLVAAVIAFVRRLRLEPAKRFSPTEDSQFLRSLTFAVLGVGVAISLAVALQVGDNFTALYLLGPEGQLEAYPSHLRPGEPFIITVAVENREWRALRYRLDISLDQELLSALESTRVLKGGLWTSDLQLIAPAQPGRHQLTIDLFRGRGRTSYRQVHLDLTVLAVAGQEGP